MTAPETQIIIIIIIIIIITTTTTTTITIIGLAVQKENSRKLTATTAV